MASFIRDHLYEAAAMVLFAIGQRYFIEGIVLTGVKG